MFYDVTLFLIVRKSCNILKVVRIFKKYFRTFWNILKCTILKIVLEFYSILRIVSFTEYSVTFYNILECCKVCWNVLECSSLLEYSSRALKLKC